MLRIGSLTLSSNVCLAPLAGWTTLAFRRVVREIGGLGMATTEVVMVRPLLTRSRQAEEYIQTHPDDRPLAVQISADDPQEAADGARLLERRGYPVVDLNMGCPVRKIARKGRGAALARDCASATEVARACAQAVKIPVTAKLRLGWDEGDLTAPDLAKALADAGVAAIAIHGRTRAQGFQGSVCLRGIRAVVEAVPGLPVLGNGDVKSALDAKRMIDETGCAGVLIGRAAVTNPWIFAETRALLDTGRLPEPAPLEARLARCERHYRLLAEHLHYRPKSRHSRELVAALRFRKVLRAWGVALGLGKWFSDEAIRVHGPDDLRRLLERAHDALTSGERAESLAEPVVTVPDRPTDHW